jgi:hypothetical protein
VPDIGELASAFVAIRPQTNAAAFETEARGQIVPSVGRIASDAAAAFAAVKIFNFAKSGIDELKDSQAVAAQTTTVLKNLGPAAGTSAEEVDRLSESMLKQSGVDDEVAKSAENTLLRLGVQGDAFRRATQESNDLATAMGTDMTSAAELLGKALAHPEQAARLLKPAIGGLTTEQLDAIKAFQATGDAAGAQGIILDAVAAKTKGAAAAFGETLPGQVAIAQESMKNAKAEMVAGLAPALQLGAQGVTFFATEMGKLPQPVQEVVGGVGLLAAGVGAVARPLNDAITLFGRFRTGTKEVSDAEEASTAITDAKTASTVAAVAAEDEYAQVNLDYAATEAEVVAAGEARTAAMAEQAMADGAAAAAAAGLAEADMVLAGAEEATVVAGEEATVASAGMFAALGPLGIAAGIAAAAVMLFAGSDKAAAEASRNMDAADKQLADGLAGLAGTAGSTTGQFKSMLDGFVKGDQVIGSLFGENVKLNDILDKTGQTTGSLSKMVADGNGEFGRWVSTMAASHQITTVQADALVGLGIHMEKVAQDTIDAAVEQGKLSAADRDAAESKAKNQDGTTNYAAALDLLNPKIHEATTATQGLDTANVDLAKAQDALTTAVTGTTSALDSAYQSTISTQKLTADYQANIDALTKSVHDNGKTLDDNTDKGRANIAAADAAGESIVKLIQKRFDETHSLQAARDAGTFYVQGLRDQLSQAGMNQTQIDALITTMKLTPDDINTTFSNNAPEIQAIVKKLKDQVDLVPPEQRTEFLADIDHGSFDEAQALLDGLKKPIEVPVHIQSVTSDLAGGTRVLASGGAVKPMEQFHAAEQGAELLTSEGYYRAFAGGHVWSAPETSHLRQMLGNAASSQPTSQAPAVNFNGPVTFGSNREETTSDLNWFALTKLGV